MYNKIINAGLAILFFFLVIPIHLIAQQLSSPDGHLTLRVKLNEAGAISYQLDFKKQPVIESSGLGMELVDAEPLIEGFEIINVKYDSLDQVWQPIMGEQRNIRSHYNEMLLSLKQKFSCRKMSVRFRIFNDGLGFRYEFPQQDSLRYFIIKEEKTQFKLTGDLTALWMRGDYDTNEYPYSRTKLSQIKQEWSRPPFPVHAQSPVKIPSVQTPLMLFSPGKLYINIHEAALSDYPAMQLEWMADRNTFESHLTPDALGNKGFMESPRNTPWRTVLISDKASGIVASKLVLNLNEPCSYQDLSWIKPVKYIGVWWEYFVTGKSNWAYGKDGSLHGANTTNVKRYIDFAATHGFDAVLVEGWNKGWEDWFGNWKENVFDFITPYPDFDVTALKNYAHKKGVQLIMHHETSGSVANYERYMDTAFRFMKENGYRTVKTGYVGRIIPRGEHHDGQTLVNHYIHVAKKAAQFQIMVNSHEAVRPTGLNRTYPNWIAQESARGTEFESMGGLAPSHSCILPFTRLVGGPMDYTPGIFQTDLSWYAGNKGRVNTTLVKQLAYYVTMYSPFQMAADLPENYERFPDAFQFIKDVSVDWDSSYVLEAEPGDFLTIARKSRDKESWFIGGITNEHARTAKFNLSFLPAGRKFMARIYNDAKDASYNKNPQAYTIRELTVCSGTTLSEFLAPGGGLAISVTPLTENNQSKREINEELQ